LVEQFWKQNLSLNYATLFGSAPDWEVLLRHIAPPGSRPEARLGFELRHSAPQPVIPEGLSLAPISARLAQAILDGSGTAGFGIDPWFIRVAGGPEAYAADGLGLALMDGDQIVSLCGVCGLGGGEAEMEVGTVLSYRGRGLAPIVCAAFMDQAKSRGILPAYTCSSDNPASRAVARKLGFVQNEEIYGYRLYK
jgi:GNAT superfamily N-acetyltransferase